MAGIYYTVGMKKNLMRSFALCIFLVLLRSAFAAENVESSELSLEYGSGVFHIFTLQNGFTVFVREDNTAALLHTEFVCKAGYSSQTPLNTGFFLLYSRILQNLSAKSSKGEGQSESEKSIFEEIPLVSSCNADSSTFTADVPRNSFEDFLQEHPYLRGIPGGYHPSGYAFRIRIR